jgi:hypothetical protein
MHANTLLDKALRVLVEAYQRDLTGRSPSGRAGGSSRSDREACAVHVWTAAKPNLRSDER